MLKTLLKLQFAQFFSSLGNRRSKKGADKPRSRGSMILLGILLAYCAVVFMGMSGMFFYSLGSLVGGTENAWLFFAVLATLVFLVDFIFTIFTAKSQLFEAKDNEALLSLPIRPRDILLSRMLMIVLTDYLFEVIIVLPAIVVWCILGHASVTGILAFLIGVICMPGLSLALSSFVGWLLYLVTSRMKNPAIVSTVLGAVIFVIYLFGCMKLGGGVTITEEMTLKLADGLSGALFFPFRAFGIAAAGGNFAWLFVYIAFMLIPFAILVRILSASFLSLATRQKGSVKAVYREKAQRAGSQRSALVRNEFRRIVSSSAYMLNGGMGMLLTLVLAIGVFFIPISELIAEGIPVNLIAAIAAGMLAFLSSMTLFTASAVSMEGQNIYLLQSLPLPGHTVLTAKLIPHMVLSAPLTLIASITCAIAIRPTPGVVVAMLLVPQVYNAATAVIGLSMNLALPRFDFTDETQVLKQSGAVGFTMLITTVGGIMAMAPGIVIGVFTGNVTLGIALAAVIPLAVTIVLYQHIVRNGDSIFQRLG